MVSILDIEDYWENIGPEARKAFIDKLNITSTLTWRANEPVGEQLNYINGMLETIDERLTYLELALEDVRNEISNK